MYRAIHPHDPQGILQYEWLNSRAAIPKFEYKAIEIRILDSQECVQADIAIALTIHAILKYWSMKSSYYLDNPCETKRLKTVYEETVNAGFQVQIEDAELARQWLLPKRSMSVRSIWSHLIEKISHELDYTTQKTLEFILNHGNLSERLLNACGNEINHATLTRTYRQLSHCLLANQLFNPT